MPPPTYISMARLACQQICGQTALHHHSTAGSLLLTGLPARYLTTTEQPGQRPRPQPQAKAIPISTSTARISVEFSNVPITSPARRPVSATSGLP